MNRTVAVALCALSLTAVIAEVAAQQPANTYKPSVERHAELPKVNPATSSSWSDHNGDLANTRYSPINQITSANEGFSLMKAQRPTKNTSSPTA